MRMLQLRFRKKIQKKRVWSKLYHLTIVSKLRQKRKRSQDLRSADKEAISSKKSKIQDAHIYIILKSATYRVSWDFACKTRDKNSFIVHIPWA